MLPGLRPSYKYLLSLDLHTRPGNAAGPAEGQLTGSARAALAIPAASVARIQISNCRAKPVEDRIIQAHGKTVSGPSIIARASAAGFMTGPAFAGKNAR